MTGALTHKEGVAGYFGDAAKVAAGVAMSPVAIPQALGSGLGGIAMANSVEEVGYHASTVAQVTAAAVSLGIAAEAQALASRFQPKGGGGLPGADTGGGGDPAPGGGGGSKGQINIDTGSAVAFISEGSPIRHALKAVVGEKQMIMTETALAELRGTLRVAGPAEAARADRFLSRVQAVADNPSLRALALKVTKSVGANDIQVFGTADRMRVTTMTSDAKFLRGASAQGVDFDTHLHQPVPLQGK